MSKKSQKSEVFPVNEKQPTEKIAGKISKSQTEPEVQPIGERVAVLETKLAKPMTEEERYQKRVELYEKNVAIRKKKREKLEALQAELGEDI